MFGNNKKYKQLDVYWLRGGLVTLLFSYTALHSESADLLSSPLSYAVA